MNSITWLPFSESPRVVGFCLEPVLDTTYAQLAYCRGCLERRTLLTIDRHDLLEDVLDRTRRVWRHLDRLPSSWVDLDDFARRLAIQYALAEPGLIHVSPEERC